MAYKEYKMNEQFNAQQKEYNKQQEQLELRPVEENDIDKTPKDNNPLDIGIIIDKIDKLKIPDDDKAFLLTQIKKNMMTPSFGEDDNLNRIQQKYTSHLQNNQQPYQQPQQQPHQQPYQQQKQQQKQQPYQQQYQQQYHQPYNNSIENTTNNIMTTMHFDILKNKLDAVQLELIDLLRHVKDYTQRYMNATRQQDMEKIDAYITGLFEVDKKIQQVREEAQDIEQSQAKAQREEEEPETHTSIIGKATSGIKNFFGSIGNNVAGVANLVSSTASIANNYLSKPVIGGIKTSNVSPDILTTNNTKNLNTKNTDTHNSNTKNTTIQTKIPENKQISNMVSSSNSNFNNNISKTIGKNIVSIDEYIRSNANNLNKPLVSYGHTGNNNNTGSNNHTGDIISTNANYINSLSRTPINIKKNILQKSDTPEQAPDAPEQEQDAPEQEQDASEHKPDVPEQEQDEKEQEQDVPEQESDDITDAIKKINSTINTDINQTINDGDKILNDSKQQVNPDITTETIDTIDTIDKQKIQIGGLRHKKYTNKLFNNIKLLKLQLTKHKLSSELQKIKKKHIIINNKKTNKKTNNNKRQTQKKK